jgi:hypothetical protein
MLIGYHVPASPTVGIYAPGSGWLTADGGSACVDGKPARRARFGWRTNAPALADFCALYVDFTQAFVPRVGCVLGLQGVPEGVRLEAVGITPGGANFILGGNGGTQRTVRFADGTIGVFWVFGAAEAAISDFELRIYNDRNGVTWANAATQVDVGEVAVMPAVDVEHQSDWAVELVDPSTTSFSRGAQPGTSQRQAYRRMTCSLAAQNVAVVRAGGLANGMDWDQLAHVMVGDRRAIAIPRWRTPAGAVAVAEVQRTSLYGLGRLTTTGHLGGDYYGATAVFQEVPATL